MPPRPNPKLTFWVVGGAFLLSLLLSYYGVIFHHYPLPPGDDIYAHLQNILLIQRQGVGSFGSGYPPGLYLLVLALHRLTGLSVIRTLLLLAPALLPLSGLAVWLLARKVYGEKPALIAYLLYALVSLQPLQTYFDGSLPNLLAADILLPLLFWSLLVWLEKPRRAWWAALLSLLILGAIFLSHHLTVIILLLVALPWGIVIAIRAAVATGKSWIALLGTVAAVGILPLTDWAFFTFRLFQPARGVFLAFFYPIQHFPYVEWIALPSSPTWNARLYGLSLGGLIFQAGVVGGILVLLHWRRLGEVARKGSLLLVIWLAVYLAGSFSQWSGEPSRLARDLAMPGCILAGYLIFWLYGVLRQAYRPLAVVWSVLVIGLGMAGFLTRASYLEGVTPMVRFSSADEAAFQYLRTNGLFPDTLILERGPYWESVVPLEDKTVTVRAEGMRPYGQAQTADCYLVGWFVAGVWPSTYSDPSIAQSYLSSPKLIVRQRFSDPIQTLYLVCRKQS